MSVLNNGALVAGELFAVTGLAGDRDRCTADLEAALALAPADTVLQRNLAQQLLAAGAHAVIGETIDQHALRRHGDLGLIDFLCRDQAARDAWTARYAAHPHVRRAVALGERLVVLSPRDASAYTLLVSVHGWTRDAAGLRLDRDRLAAAQLDRAEIDRANRDGWAGTHAERNRTAVQAQIARLQAALAGSALTGPSRAVAQCQLAESRLALARLGGEAADHDAGLALAEQAHAAAPSLGTRRCLRAMLAERAVARLAAGSPWLAAVCARCRRSLGAAELLVFAAGHDAGLRERVAADADVQRLLAMRREEIAAVPRRATLWDWALASHLDAGRAEELGRLVASDEIDQLERECLRALDPGDGGVVIMEHWRHLLAGDRAGAAKVLAAAAAAGMPLPVE